MEKSRTKIFIINIITSTVYQIIIFAVGIILPRIIMQYYGSEVNGFVSSIVQILSCFALVESGLSGAGVFALFKPISNNNISKINSIISALQHSYSRVAILFLIISLAFALIFPLISNIHFMQKNESTILIIIIAAGTVLDFLLLGKYRVFLTAHQKVYIVSIVSILYTVLNTVIFIIITIIFSNILLAKLLALMAILIRTVLLSIYIKRHFHNLNFHVKPNYQAINKRWDALYLSILASIHTSGGIIILTLFLGDYKTISMYSVYNMVFLGLNGIIGIFVNGLGSSFGDVIAKNEKDILKTAYNQFELAYYALTAFLFSVTSVMILPFIKLYTSGITDAEYFFPVIAGAFVLDSVLFNIKGPQAMMVTASGLFKETRRQTTVQGILKIFLGIILLYKIGVLGVIIASIISNIYRDIDLIIFSARHITGASMLNTSKRILIIVFVFLIVHYSTFIFDCSIQNYSEWIILATKVSLVSLTSITLLCIILDFKTTRALIKRFYILLKKRNTYE